MSQRDDQTRRLSVAGWLCFLTLGTVLVSATATFAQERTAVINESVVHRFARTTDEVPQSRRHVIPLLARLGCSAAACHGAKGGQAGFELSLFGHDHQADVTEMSEEGSPPRANWHAPSESLLLRKPTLLDEHQGGKLFAHDSWEYRLLFNWISARAPGISAGKKWIQLERLEVAPIEIIATRGQPTVQLKAVAHWTDSSAEDVTPLCRFRSNNEGVATVSSDGEVAACGAGDTHIIVFYDTGIVAVPIVVPHSPSAKQGAATPASAATQTKSKTVDQLIGVKLDKLGVAPAELCGDSQFLRRVTLDLTGTLPTPAEVRQFLADTSVHKREHAVRRLLDSENYASWWATWFCDLMGNSDTLMPDAVFRQEQSQWWYDWMRERIRTNVGYDKIVAGVLYPESRLKGQSAEEFYREMSSYISSPDLRRFSERPSMPYFWHRMNMRSSENKTLAFSYVFLGVSLQCAQCHKHPFDRWTKEDFDNLEAFFATLRIGPPEDARQLYGELRESIIGQRRNSAQLLMVAARAGKLVPWEELYYQPVTDNRNTRQASTRRKSDANIPSDPMSYLMNWLLDPAHPYLAISTVNRVWHHYFGVGIVDPVDDLNLASPPSNRELLDYLANGFIASGYDLKWLHHEIVSSDAYQRHWKHPTLVDEDRRNFSHAILRRLPAEVIYDAVWQATALDPAHAWEPEGSLPRMIGSAAGLGRNDRRNGMLERLGKPNREAVCERTRFDDPSLAQSFFLQNDPAIIEMFERPTGWLATLRKHDDEGVPHSTTIKSPVDDMIEEAYLRTLSRSPSPDELRECRQFVAESKSLGRGMQSVLWALINTKEFCLNW